MVTSVGYYPSRANSQFAREVQITYEPIPSFKYAIFSQTALSVANNMTVMGDIYSAGDITVGTKRDRLRKRALVGRRRHRCRTAHRSSRRTRALGCSGKSGNVWTGGTNGIAGRHDRNRRRAR